MTTTILVIEDDKLLREEIVHWLTLEEYRTFAAGAGEVGLSLAHKYVPDLIISDIMMPGMDGYGVLAEVRADRSLANVPVIFLTARAERNAVRYGMGLGADDYITKPFTRYELLTAIQSRLQQRSLVEASAHREMDELRNQLVRTLPHELMTPLSGIIGLAEVLCEEADAIPPHRAQEMASFILASARRIQHLVENYLSYAELELISRYRNGFGKLPQAVTYEAAEVIELACHLIAGETGRAEDLALDVSETPVAVQSKDLEKIVAEITDNAFKFSHPGQPVWVHGTVDGEWFVLSIRDKGRGMTAQQIRRIGAYMQFDRAIHEQQGAGLGAIVARRLVEMYGGRFDIESAPGAGTTVHMYLPLPGNDVIQPFVG